MTFMDEHKENTQLAQIILEIVKALPAVLQALPPIHVQVELTPSSELQRLQEKMDKKEGELSGELKRVSARQDAQHRTIYELMDVLRRK